MVSGSDSLISVLTGIIKFLLSGGHPFLYTSKLNIQSDRGEFILIWLFSSGDKGLMISGFLSPVVSHGNCFVEFSGSWAKLGSRTWDLGENEWLCTYEF